MVCSGGRPGNFSSIGLKHPHTNQVPTPEPGPSSCVTFFNSFCTLAHHPGHPADLNTNDGFYFRQIKIKHQILELTSAHLTRHCKFVPWIIKTLEIYGKCFPQIRCSPVPTPTQRSAESLYKLRQLRIGRSFTLLRHHHH